MKILYWLHVTNITCLVEKFFRTRIFVYLDFLDIKYLSQVLSCLIKRLMSGQPLPVCDFLCGPPNSNDYFVTLCHTACAQRANCALTPNILYTFVNGIVSNENFFVTGVGSIFSNQLSSLALRVAIYQQIPWLIGFIIIMVILVMAGLILPSSAVLFTLAAALIAALFVYFVLADTFNTLNDLATSVQSQLATDYINARTQINKDVSGPLFQSVVASQVPCGCTCPINVMPGGAD